MIVVDAIAVLICRVFRKTDTISVDIWMEVSDSQLDSGGLAGERTQGGKTLAAKPDDQSVVPEPSGERREPTPTRCSLISTRPVAHVYSHIRIDTINKM